MRVAEFLVQVTVVAGPPVEMQVRVNRGLGPLRSEVTASDIPPGMETAKVEREAYRILRQWNSTLIHTSTVSIEASTHNPNHQLGVLGQTAVDSLLSLPGGSPAL